MIDKKSLSERDICTKYITPAVEKAGWDRHTQFLEEVSFTDGKIIVRGRLHARGTAKRADYILYYKPNIPLAIIEAKDNKHTLRAGLQQALDYARILDLPFVFSSNGDGFLFHDKTATEGNIETELDNDSFPAPAALWAKYKLQRGLTTPDAETIAAQSYYDDGSGRQPRYYQQIAVNRTVEAIATGQRRILLVMATGTGKTYTAFQIAWRLWKAGARKRILFLADRNALIEQTRRGDFKHFKDKLTVVKQHQVDKAYEIYLALYQGLSGAEEASNIYKQFSRDFFDLIIVDECHRGSARDDSAWQEILRYFNKATQIGLTATPKETEETSNSEYFGDPIYTYSLKQGIDDGFLAPYRVVRVALDIDLEGWRPPQGFKDKAGKPVEDRIYNRTDFDKNLVVEERRKLVARKLTEFLKGTDRYDKTIAFCCDIEHAEGMTSELRNANADIAAANYKYVMQITGDNDEGKRELENFTNPEEKFPVIAATSELMTTGVDARTCKVIVLDSNIKSMTKFKQIIGRGTRIDADHNKFYFTILDFRNATDLFADQDFDGDPIRIKPAGEDEDLSKVIDEEEHDQTPLIDPESGEEITLVPPQIRNPFSGAVSVPREKVYVSGVDVSVLVARELSFDRDGKLITRKLTDYTREVVTEQFATLNEFLNKWHAADRKEVLIRELEEQGVPIEALRESVAGRLDLFDLICHVAYDQPPLTRRERANNVRKRDYFTKYGAQARQVLEALLDKYADEGIEDIENIKVLNVRPFTEIGSPLEIIREFGSREQYLAAVRELESELYKTA
ncbi:MAG: DEAD/DEAH box helicase family protein [Acidobacteria bacterium]|nr:DEAD/DEAH box helicase family protein [Acidobacteriota bacterium]MBI3425120.1 DEAD/DEAH box helicase family protein [Acidobacteriota bacterium]